MHIKKAAWQDFPGDDKRTDKCGHMGQDDNHNGRQPHSYTRTTDDCKSGRQKIFFSFFFSVVLITNWIVRGLST